MSRCYPLLVSLLLIASTALFADEAAPPTEQEIKTLIDQLVSPNPPPITGDQDRRQAPDYRLPAGFDRAKQKPIHQARFKLKQVGPAAFPHLVDCWDDKRYSLTVSDGLSGYCYNQSAGDVCRAIMFDQLQPYSVFAAGHDDPRGQPPRPSYPGTYLTSLDTAKAWCERNKGRSLYELQLGILDWVIATESKRPTDYTDQERERLEAMRKKFIESKQPLAPGNYYRNDLEE